MLENVGAPKSVVFGYGGDHVMVFVGVVEKTIRDLGEGTLLLFNDHLPARYEIRLKEQQSGHSAKEIRFCGPD